MSDASTGLTPNGKLPGRGLVAHATAIRLRELGDQLESLEKAGILEWEHMDALRDQLGKLMDSMRRAREMFGWADELVSDGGKKTLDEIVNPQRSE